MPFFCIIIHAVFFCKLFIIYLYYCTQYIVAPPAGRLRKFCLSNVFCDLYCAIYA
jgi:hypothetical protein